MSDFGLDFEQGKVLAQGFRFADFDGKKDHISVPEDPETCCLAGGCDPAQWSESRLATGACGSKLSRLYRFPVHSICSILPGRAAAEPATNQTSAWWLAEACPLTVMLRPEFLSAIGETGLSGFATSACNNVEDHTADPDPAPAQLTVVLVGSRLSLYVPPDLFPSLGLHGLPLWSPGAAGATTTSAPPPPSSSAAAAGPSSSRKRRRKRQTQADRSVATASKRAHQCALLYRINVDLANLKADSVEYRRLWRAFSQSLPQDFRLLLGGRPLDPRPLFAGSGVQLTRRSCEFKANPALALPNSLPLAHIAELTQFIHSQEGDTAASKTNSAIGGGSNSTNSNSTAAPKPSGAKSAKLPPSGDVMLRDVIDFAGFALYNFDNHDAMSNDALDDSMGYYRTNPWPGNRHSVGEPATVQLRKVTGFLGNGTLAEALTATHSRLCMTRSPWALLSVSGLEPCANLSPPSTGPLAGDLVLLITKSTCWIVQCLS